MVQKTIFTTITPIPGGVSREVVLETLHSHLEMIDLNPSHEERHRIQAPPEASPEEYHCVWYQITDKVSYLPANLYTGKVTFKACFHDLAMGVQTHCYAPLGLDIKEKWTIGGSLPHEPAQPVEIGLGAPMTGLYLREDVEIKCNFLLTKFVKKSLKQALATLVARLVVKSQLQENENRNKRLTYDPSGQSFSPPQSPAMYPPMSPSMSPSMSPPLPYSQVVQPMSAVPGQQYQQMPLSPGQIYKNPNIYNTSPQQIHATEMDAGHGVHVAPLNLQQPPQRGQQPPTHFAELE